MREMQTQLAESKHILRVRLDTANFVENTIANKWKTLADYFGVWVL